MDWTSDEPLDASALRAVGRTAISLISQDLAPTASIICSSRVLAVAAAITRSSQTYAFLQIPLAKKKPAFTSGADHAKLASAVVRRAHCKSMPMTVRFAQKPATSFKKKAGARKKASAANALSASHVHSLHHKIRFTVRSCWSETSFRHDF